MGLYLPLPVKKKLTALAKSQERSISGLVRIIVEQYLNKQT